ncbi:MAG: ABC transporter permease [Dehalococcoidia bacterium]|nr:ABC transporter permease [Dehalococcoidia bacterium]
MTEDEIRGKMEPSRVRGIAKRVFRHENAVLGIVLAAVVGGMAGITKGLILNPANMMNVLLQSSIRGVAAVGQAFVILTAGIDLSVAGMGLFASMLGASMMTATPEQNIVGYVLSPYIAIPVMLLVGAAWGAANGSLVSRVGMPALIVTLGMWEICKGAAFQLGGGRYIIELPDSLNSIGAGAIGGVPVLVIIFIAVTVTGYFVLHHTTFGKSVYAVGGNPVTAWLSGINVKNILFTVYAISGFLAGLAGVMFTARTMSSMMRTLSGLELDTIAAVTVGGISLAGGRGTIIGVVLGVLIIGIINNGMSVLGATLTHQGIVKGGIIIAAVAIDCIRRRRD